jgi:hypothetical protein
MKTVDLSAGRRVLLLGLLCAVTCWICATSLSCSGDEEPVQAIPNSLSGTVVDADGGKALPKVNITLGSFSTRTNGQGEYTITGLNKATYSLEATLSGYYDYSAEVSVSGLTEHNFSMHLERTGTK